MKKLVTNHVIELGGIATYSGKTKTMYISTNNVSGIDPTIIEDEIFSIFGYGLPFRITT